MERNNRKTLTGIVVTDQADKTINVLVETYKNHPLYKKRVKYSKKYLAHDENSIAHKGDKVEIMETRPMSKNKHFRLIRIVEKAIK